MPNNPPNWELLLLFIQAGILVAQLYLMYIIHKYNRNNDRERWHRTRVLEVISSKMIEETRYVKFSEIHNELKIQYPKEKYMKYETYYLLGILKSEGIVHNTLGNNKKNRDPDLFTTAHRFLTGESELPTQDKERIGKSRLLKLLAENNPRKQISFEDLYDRITEKYPEERYEESEILYKLGILKTEKLVYITVGENIENSDIKKFTIKPRFLTEPQELPKSENN